MARAIAVGLVSLLCVPCIGIILYTLFREMTRDCSSNCKGGSGLSVAVVLGLAVVCLWMMWRMYRINYNQVTAEGVRIPTLAGARMVPWAIITSATIEDRCIILSAGGTRHIIALNAYQDPAALGHYVQSHVPAGDSRALHDHRTLS